MSGAPASAGALVGRRAVLALGLGALTASRASLAGAQAALGGPIDGVEPDDLGILLPDGFSARVVAVGGVPPVAGSSFAWPLFPDGAAVIPAPDDGWFHVVNSEVPFVGEGGASVLRFSADGQVTDAYPVLTGTRQNCAGGSTPWGTWLSCEEFDDGPGAGAGLVFECDPTAKGEGEPLPALGAFQHEAVVVDPEGGRCYLSEDQPDGLLYRFTPLDYPDLSEGLLEACARADDGSVTWVEVPDPSASTTATRLQVAEATAFNGGEGLWFHDGKVWFTTKGDNRVWVLDVADDRLDVVYDAATYPDEHDGAAAPLTGVDNVTVHPSTGLAFVAEDGGNMELVLLDSDGTVAPVVRFTGPEHEGSEVTGPCFTEDGRTLYVSSQRGRLGPSEMGRLGEDYAGVEMTFGITYEITGPFDELGTPASMALGGDPEPSAPMTSDAGSTDAVSGVGDAVPMGDGVELPEVGDGDVPPAVPIALAAGGVVAAGAAVAVARRRGDPDEADWK